MTLIEGLNQSNDERNGVLAVNKNSNVPNEAKRLLKTKDRVFPAEAKAKRLLRINELRRESQEVVEK